jgi:hypothetical protein
VPAQGDLLLPEEVDSVIPPVKGREVVAWLVTGEATRAIVAEIRWGVPVVEVAQRDGASSPPTPSSPPAPPR